MTCFCPILIRKENNFVDTEYILVGGYVYSQNRGIIKLFKISLKGILSDSTIKFIRDIPFEENMPFKDEKVKFPGFKNEISYILQSEITGNILISCLDGNTYLLTKPNIDYYLREN